jgi:hypothetical protein
MGLGAQTLFTHITLRLHSHRNVFTANFRTLFSRIATPLAQKCPLSCVIRLFPLYLHVFALIRNGKTIHTINTLFAHDPRTLHSICRSCVSLFSHYSHPIRTYSRPVWSRSRPFTHVPTCECDIHITLGSPPRRCRKMGRGGVWRRPQSHLRRFFCAIFLKTVLWDANLKNEAAT